MTFRATITAAFQQAAQELAESIESERAALQLVSMKEAAQLLGVSQPKARRLLREVVELGEASRRVRLSAVKRLIDERTICLNAKAHERYE